ncbi:restriction endonuclease subunit S [Methylotuvimicrobium alcaliphilum]|uniref:Restriction endonuclease S subunits (Modular protein) n=1 Tax=Methylotuvimicrobium alcaliphilum (strain DSM 19304 / NCIMB 14124 / VKM B-2133 / 20Z) TaxID=1091494 RepID=G4T424_META2|nr:restriction endonuclease subunit S [Methylotuvimicrobium alcaliphilum]CCE23759.1 Restriction endonuclease S subunits (modular protein) [Methylotuvimicrobium alcaliphilum 20Z]
MHVPDGWKLVELVNLSKNEKNSFVIGPFGSDLVQSDYRCNGVPVVFVRDVKRNRFEWVSNVYVTKEKAEKLVAHSVKSNDILITKMGLPPGIAALYPMNILPGVITADIIRLRPNLSLTDPIFLCSVLNSYSISKQVYFRTGGQTRPKLTLADYRTIKILLPSLPEQQKIAQILSTWDKAVEKLEALIAAKQKRKKALMQQLLTGKKRFAGFEGEWKTFHLAELFKERNETGHVGLNLLSITREKGVIPRNEVERKDTSNDNKSKYLRICAGDIGYNTMRMWQGVSALSTLEGIISPAYTVCIPTDKIDGKFAAYLFKSMPIVHLFQRYSQGLTSDTWNLKFHHFGEIKVYISEDVQEQKKIASVLSAADTEIQTHQKQLATLKQQKKGLMQQLLTGKKRVKVEAHV